MIALAPTKKSWGTLRTSLARPSSPVMPKTTVVLTMHLADLKDKASEWATKWSAKTSPVPKATRLHAEQIAQKAKEFEHEIADALGLPKIN